ncbi:MAG: type IV pilin protein [Methylococcaceae bacterium]|nr:type IV pilin protein [Methylococcaceae bacterium]
MISLHFQTCVDTHACQGEGVENLGLAPLAARTKTRGFTLIDLMVAVAIVGIIATIAYPSYMEYVRRANRSEAKAILLETAQFLERNFTVANRFDKDSAAADIVLPYTHSPKSGTAKYDITVTYPAAGACTLGQCFTLSAAPTGSMTGDACGTYTLTQAGVQGSGGTVADCWQR